ncbi:hypothetical protein [Terrarubrum flagellatum]|uniref:hypothetical protein n=1 Tax=Terrirubrum flagellatum TaxID=2895980 RepID=UPI003144E2B2
MTTVRSELYEETPSEFDRLLSPANAYDHPRDILNDPDLTRNEKRAILASWASDACAVEANPALREARDGLTVPFDAIIDALRQLDRPPSAPRRGDGNIFGRRSRAVAGRTSARRPSVRPDLTA